MSPRESVVQFHRAVITEVIVAPLDPELPRSRRLGRHGGPEDIAIGGPETVSGEYPSMHEKRQDLRFLP